MNNNSSFHTLNGDKKLSKIERVLWLVLNFFNNKFFPNKSNLSIRQFSPKIHDKDWKLVDLKSSPTRVLSDFFWIKLNWTAIDEELSGINILDTGCGNGEYFLKLDQYSNNCIKSYCGLDIEKKDKWESLKKENNNIDFNIINSNDLVEHIPKDTNLFISQSAIEHFDDDLIYFRNIKSHIDKYKNNTIQIHLFPSAACIKKYLWHGIRQYTPRTISKITDIFDDDKTYSVLYKLGGENCNKLHLDYITKPIYLKKIDYRDTKYEEYVHGLKNAIKYDLVENGNPSFYALVIHSHYNTKVFDKMNSLGNI